MESFFLTVNYRCLVAAEVVVGGQVGSAWAACAFKTEKHALFCKSPKQLHLRALFFTERSFHIIQVSVIFVLKINSVTCC